jgi:hypothetical protein
MHRPKWMAPSTFDEFVERWADEDGKIRCVGIGCQNVDDSRITVDHIVARSANGTDELSNLQPLCDICNSRKGDRPDDWWKRSLYFDKPLVTAGLRVSQHDYIYNRIREFADFFSRPSSAINGKLFCFLQVVGAGKTLGMFVLAFALNQCKTKQWGAAPRIDRMLIVTKDKALRRQIASELRDEPVKFGLVNEAPRVSEITRGDMLIDSGADYDIAVMCPNMLWPQAGDGKDGRELMLAWPAGIERVLNRYPLIIFDEMHYAHQGIRLLINAARHSLVFGFTASPVKGCGELLEDMVKMSVYTYHDAVLNDGSMKFLR